MEYSEDRATLAEWMPLMMPGRDPSEPIAATRAMNGTDVNFGAVTSQLLGYPARSGGVRFPTTRRSPVSNVPPAAGRSTSRTPAPVARVRCKPDSCSSALAVPRCRCCRCPASRRARASVVSRSVVSGCAATTRNRQAAPCQGLQRPRWAHRRCRCRTSIPAWSMARSLCCSALRGFHHQVPQARFVHGPAAVDSPEQHRPDDGRRSRQHGPYPLPDQGSDAVHGGSHATLRGYPEAKAEDWRLEIAGQRVQIIKKDPKKGGILQFGTELVAAKDGTIAALLGASPGASVTVSIMLDLLERCFPSSTARRPGRASCRKCSRRAKPRCKTTRQPIVRSARWRTSASA